MTDKRRAPRTVINCAWCGAPFEVLTSRLKHLTGKSYCSPEHVVLGRVRTRKEGGGYASLPASVIQKSREQVKCSRGCGSKISRNNLSRHEASCLWPRTFARFKEIGSLVKEGDCLIWHGSSSGHYGAVDGDHAHRVAWQIVSELPIPSGMVIRHTCDRPGCVEPSHLVLGTTAENIKDAMERGRRKGGFETWPKEKLTEMIKTKRHKQTKEN